MKKIFIIMMFLLTLPMLAVSQVSMHGGKGLLRIWEAETVYPGALIINPLYSAYATGNNEDFSEDHTLNLGLTAGISEQFEVFAHLVPYQDDQVNTWGPIGDTQLSLKYHIPNGESFSQFGIVSSLIFPTSLHHNLPYESYSDNALGWSLTGLATFDLKNISATFPLKFSVNLGYKDNNSKDAFFSSRKDQLTGGIGFKFPIRTSLLYSEFTGEFFINNGDITPSQNFSRFTQGFRFVGPWHLICDIAGDIELGNFKPENENLVLNPYLKDYADWKLMFGISYRTNLFTGKTKKEKEQELLKQSEQEDMETIQQKRKDVVKDLEELRKQLENEKKPKTE